MDWLLDLLGFNKPTIQPAAMASGTGTQQQLRGGIDPNAVSMAEKPTGPEANRPALSTGGGASGGRAQTMTSDFAKILAATLMSTPSLTFPGAVAPPRAVPFQFQPGKVAFLGDRRPLGR